MELLEKFSKNSMMDGFSEEKFNFQCGNGGKEFLETQAIDDDDDIIYLGKVLVSFFSLSVWN